MSDPQEETQPKETPPVDDPGDVTEPVDDQAVDAPLDVDAIPEELVEIVREVQDDPEKVRTVLEMFAWTWKGPLPHPKALAAFNTAYDGCARDIVDMTRSQSQHRQALEMKVADADIKLRQRGQHCGFVIAMTVIVGGLIVVGLGRPVTGFGTILAGLGGVVGLFLYSRHRQDTQLAEKREALDRSIEPETAVGSENGPPAV